MGKLGPPGVTCSKPQGVAQEVTLDYSPSIRDRVGSLSTHLDLKLLCCWLVRGSLGTIPAPVNNYLLNAQPPMSTVVLPSHT